MQIERIELSPDQTKAKVTTINGFWFSATRLTETYQEYNNTWRKEVAKTIAPTWISLAIKRMKGVSQKEHNHE